MKKTHKIILNLFIVYFISYSFGITNNIKTLVDEIQDIKTENQNNVLEVNRDCEGKKNIIKFKDTDTLDFSSLKYETSKIF